MTRTHYPFEGLPKEKTSLVPSLAWLLAKHTAQNAHLPIHLILIPTNALLPRPQHTWPEKPNCPKL